MVIFFTVLLASKTFIALMKPDVSLKSKKT